MRRKSFVASTFLLLTVLLLSFQAAAYDVTPVSPQNDSTINGTVELLATVDISQDLDLYRRVSVTQNISGSVQNLATEKHNDTFDTTKVQNGVYNLTFQAVNSSNFNVNGSATVVNVTIDNLALDDSNPSTDTSYDTPATFIGSVLNISRGNISHTFELRDNLDQIVNQTLGYLGIKTAGESEGRYSFNDSNSSKFREIDLLKNTSDVQGRIDSEGTVEGVYVHHFLNGSRMTDAGNNKFNITTESWPPSGGSETLYRMNKTFDKYWIGVESSDTWLYKPARSNALYSRTGVPTPRITDFNLTAKPSNLTGNITYRNGTPVSGLKLRLRRLDTFFYVSRGPYMFAPPTKHVFTNSSGGYVFEGLRKDENYLVDIINHSHSITERDNNGVRIQQKGSEVSKDFNVTSNLTNISIKIQGDQNPDIEYAYIVQNATQEFGYEYLKSGVVPETESELAVKNKSYTILAARFDYRNNLKSPVISTDTRSINISDGKAPGLIKMGFPTLVTLNGTVNSTGGSPVRGVQILASNDTQRLQFYTRTDSNGDYSMKVSNDTNYSLDVRPVYGASFESKAENITVNGDTTKSYQLAEGPYIEGWIEDENGNPIENVYIDAWNGTVNSYGDNRSLQNGYYKVGGLKEDTNYSLYVNTLGYSDKKIQVELTGDNETRNITFAKESYSLDVSVKNATGDDIEAEVEVRGSDSSNKKTITGSGSFEDLQHGFYTVIVEPTNASYKDSREFLSVNRNSSVDFNLSIFKGMTGTVEDGSGNPVSGVYINAYNSSEESFDSDKTDSNGNFQLELSTVDHKVDIWPDHGSNFQFNSTTITAGQVGGSTVFNVSKGKAVYGNVKDSNQNDLNGFISVYNSTEQAYGYDEIVNGEYNITGLKEVNYSAFVYIDGSKYSSKTFDINKSELGAQKNFTIGENEGPKLWVKVNDSTGSLLSNVTVVADGVQKTTDVDGLAKFDKQVDDQEIRVTAYRENYNSSSKLVTPKSSVSTGLGNKQVSIKNVSFTLENIRGQLNTYTINVTKSNENVSSASVVARYTNDKNPLSSSAITGSNGEAELEGILPGEYLISVSADGNFESAKKHLNSTNVNETFSIGSFDLGVESEE